MVFVLSSIYLLRYVHVYKMRQIVCAQERVEKTFWVTSVLESSSYSDRVPAGEFRFNFSRSQSPAVGELVSVIGTIRGRSQCKKMAQIDLNVQSIQRKGIMSVSPFNLIRFPIELGTIYTNKYLQGAEERLYAALPTAHSHILLGMTIGKIYSSKEETSVKMRAAGISHVLVASGANIIFVVSFTQAVLRKLFSRKNLLLGSGIVAIAYGLVVGNQAPILRATVMFLFAAGSGYVGRKIVPMYTLILGGLFILIYQPLFIYSLSFWLTMSATAAISVDSLLQGSSMTSSNESILTSLIQLLQSTVLVFLFTTPLLLYSMGEVTLTTIVSSIILLWLVSPITILGLVTICSWGIIPPLVFQFLTVILWFILELFVRYVELLSTFSFLNLTVTQMNSIGLLLYYGVLTVWLCTRLAVLERKR